MHYSYQVMCRSTLKVGGVEIQSQETTTEGGEISLGVVNDEGDPWDSWIVDLEVNRIPIQFCLDTGAEATVINKAAYERELDACHYRHQTEFLEDQTDTVWHQQDSLQLP